MPSYQVTGITNKALVVSGTIIPAGVTQGGYVATTFVRTNHLSIRYANEIGHPLIEYPCGLQTYKSIPVNDKFSFDIPAEYVVIRKGAENRVISSSHIRIM
jgi:hypothetical protein